LKGVWLAGSTEGTGVGERQRARYTRVAELVEPVRNLV
jgi:hypothetical protein